MRKVIDAFGDVFTGLESHIKGAKICREGELDLPCSRTYPQQLADLTSDFHSLPDRPEETPDSVLRSLWFTAAGEPRSCRAAMNDALPELSAGQQAELGELLEQFRQGNPVAYLSGRQSFMGLELHASPQALIPRKETEILAAAAIAKAAAMLNDRAVLTIVDVCTGSGNLALALAANIPAARVFAADLSTGAVDLARNNARRLGVEERVQFRCGDLFAALAADRLEQSCDLILCNPPYISSAKAATRQAADAIAEPLMAFDGGPLGVSILMRLLSESPALLVAGGWLGFEVGLGQGPSLARRLSANDAFDLIEPLVDANNQIRAILARKGVATRHD